MIVNSKKINICVKYNFLSDCVGVWQFYPLVPWCCHVLCSIQSDQQESKSEQALQIIGHVVAESYANKRSKHGRRQFVVSNASL
jgi:hypothetical protein